MTTKTISISEEVYKLLEKMRLPDERLDDTILRLCGVKPRGKDFEISFKKALDEVVKEDSALLERLAQ
ncbi:MAG: antitoxin VapB family protein [Candidatus Thorarchaeota archaeon]